MGMALEVSLQQAPPQAAVAGFPQEWLLLVVFLEPQLRLHWQLLVGKPAPVDDSSIIAHSSHNSS